MDLKFANSTCVVGWNGGHIHLTQGEVWKGDDPFVLAKPQFFDDAPPIVHNTTGWRTPVVDEPADIKPTGVRRRVTRG